jgi:hypothetical protein
MNTTPSSTLNFTSTTTSVGHGGGLRKYAPGLVSQARRAVAGDGSGDGSGDGFTAAAIDAPWHGDQPRSDQQVDAIRRAAAAGERALVLGGGGSAGNAWEIGVIAGRIDGRGPDKQRDPTGRTACRHPCRCPPATDWSGRIRPWTRSE